MVHYTTHHQSPKYMELLLIFSIACLCIPFLSNAKSVPIKAVNFGGWLVTEGWIKPSLFDGIPNKNYLDGTQLQFKSVREGKYLSAKNGGGSTIIAKRTTNASDFETFTLWRINEITFNFKVFNKKFVGLKNPGKSSVLVAEANAPNKAETFEIHTNPHNSSYVRIKAPNDFFLQVKSDESVTADYIGDRRWEDDNPSVFLVTIIKTMQGEYQITNGYGPRLAPKVMKKHWDTFIREKDFKFIKKSGLNAVRISVGWWITSDPNPPKPYVGGSLQALDKAFFWANKYGIRVIIDLHAAKGSQNGLENSGSRDGSLEWGKTDDNIKQTVDVIEFLVARYAESPSLLAMDLLSDPFARGVSLRAISKFYKAGYRVVRKHSQNAYVVLSNRLGPIEPRELLNLTKGMTNSVIGVHYFNLFSPAFSNFTVQQNIDYIYKNRTAQLKELTIPNGPLVFVGEWVAEMRLQNLTKKDIQRYGEAQIDVYGRLAKFGWAYWTLKNVNDHWSWEWMIKNGYIRL
ncbi:hypothetical protein OROMI_009534 [Orobanche minor]